MTTKKILIADDAAIMRLILRKILTASGYEIVGEAANGKEAVQKYEELRPDLVTMDITMPEMNGINAVRSIKRIDPDAKVVMCSAMGQKALVMEAMEAGALNFIIKPFDDHKIKEVLGKILN